MMRPRLLLILPIAFLVLVLGGVGIAYWANQGGDGDSAQTAATATGPDVGSQNATGTRETEEQRAAREYEEFRQAVIKELLEQQQAEAAAAYAAARAQDETLAADVMRRWGGGHLLMSLPSIDVSASVSGMGYEGDGRTPATPNTPWGVGWYTFTDFPGTPGNAVFSGHVDWYTGAAAVFGRLRQVKVGDPVYMVLADGTPVVYTIESTDWVDPDTADIESIFGFTDREAVTFITCGGTWNAATHDYSHRLIVRAYRVR